MGKRNNEIGLLKRGTSNLERIKPKLAVRETILIVCEGKNTEPSYFEKFKKSSVEIEVEGTGSNTVSVVKKAKQLEKRKIYAQIWCVFDADPKPSNPNQAKNFNEAITLAKKNGFGVAYSNQAFEYWFILHFEDHQGGKMPRTDYNKKINDYLKPYNIIYDGKGSKIVTDHFFDVLNAVDRKTGKDRVDLAIRRAEKIYNNCKNLSPAKRESSTAVFKLVKELQKYT